MAEEPKSIPYENLAENQLIFLKVAMYDATCTKMPNNFAKEVAIFSQMAAIQLQSHLVALARIGDNDPKFKNIRKLATDSLIALQIIDEAKPQIYQEKAMRQWKQKWQTAMGYLADIIDEILLK